MTEISHWMLPSLLMAEENIRKIVSPDMASPNPKFLFLAKTKRIIRQKNGA
ncbi:MAG: hypothetical protein IJS32_07610 [Kiritimatiellae bacterium]|nr:hypothetical protein [Kiritimatiellia bacterium]